MARMQQIAIVFAGLLLCGAAFDVLDMDPIADSDIYTGNKLLFEPESLYNDTVVAADNPYDTLHYLDVNEIPVRYDESQLWRIYNISDDLRSRMFTPVANILENDFGGIVWKENSKFLDISIDKEHLMGARNFLTANNIQTEVLHPNVQALIDSELLMGVMDSQGEMGRRSKKETTSGINWKDYHDLEVIYSFMREIRGKFPNICRLYTIGKTAQGQDLKVLRISENPRDYKKIWIDGGIHAREWISPATVTYILYQLMANWAEQPPHIKQKTWYIMPVMNPDGYTFSRKKNRLWRKNRAHSKRSNCFGVDLNRNFDIGWSGYGSSTNPCSDTYRGTAPNSELETRAVTTFLSKRKVNLEAYLTFHSYGQMVVYPWAYKAVKVKDSAALQRVANTAVQRIQKQTGSIYRASVTYEVLGIAGGGSDDWAKAALGTKYVYTIELRDRGTNGFVLPPAQIRETAMEGYLVADTVAQAIA